VRPIDRRAFEELTAAPGDGADACALAAAFKARGEATDLEALAALWLNAACAAPERLAALYDGAAQGWLGRAPQAAALDLPQTAPEPIPQEFWQAYWALLAESPLTLGAGGVTVRTAELLGLLAPGMSPRVGAASLAYPGCAEAVAQGYPHRFTIEALARCPKDSLGGEFHDLIVDNGFDLEVLDRDAMGLSSAPAPHNYLNARILQCHDLWHLAGGYRTTGLHEVAISGFQAGQFGHHYSAMFLGVVLSRVAFERPEGAAIFLDTVTTAWTHGRESPPLLGVDWEAIWDLPVDEVRARLGLTAYVSPWPADLFEQLLAAA
jgi:ubiquinone biosynthesis protein Coq4